MSRWARWLTTATFAFVLWRPVSGNGLLVPVLALLGLGSASALLRGRPMSRKVFGILAVQAVFAFYLVSLGFLNGNPGAAYGLVVYVGTPILWWVWALAHDLRMLQRTFATIVWGTVLLSASIILFTGAAQGVLPSLLPSALVRGQGAGFGLQAPGVTEIRFYGLSTLAAAGPICLAIGLLPRHVLLPKPRLALLAGFLAVVASLQGGRRAQVLAMLVSVVLVRVLSRALKVRRPRRLPGGVRVIATFGLAAAIAVTSASGLVTARTITTSARGAFNLVTAADSADASEQVRSAQAARLLHGFTEAPLTGHGYGATIDGFKRSERRPWDFELQYHLVLFQGGLVAIGAGLLLLHRARRAFKVAAVDPAMRIPLIVAVTGAAMMLLVNATNPYLIAPAHHWPIYLALATANVALTRQRQPVQRPQPVTR